MLALLVHFLLVPVLHVCTRVMFMVTMPCAADLVAKGTAATITLGTLYSTRLWQQVWAQSRRGDISFLAMITALQMS